MKGIEITGTVTHAHANYTFTVRTEHGDVQVYLTGKMIKHRIIVVPGDTVKCELCPYDLGKGRITYRL